MSCKYAYRDGIGHYEYWGAKGYDEGHICCLIADDGEIDEPEAYNLTDKQLDAIIELVKEEFESGCDGHCFVLGATEEELKDMADEQIIRMAK